MQGKVESALGKVARKVVFCEPELGTRGGRQKKKKTKTQKTRRGGGVVGQLCKTNAKKAKTTESTNVWKRKATSVRPKKEKAARKEKKAGNPRHHKLVGGKQTILKKSSPAKNKKGRWKEPSEDPKNVNKR